MGVSGSFAVSNNSAGLETELRYNEYTDSANNESLVYLTLYARTPHGTHGPGTWTLKLGGQSYTRSWSGTVGSSWTKIVTASRNYTHNSDGSLSATLAVSSGGIPGTSWTATSGKEVVKMTTFDRVPGQTPPMTIKRETTTSLIYNGSSPGGVTQTKSQHQLSVAGTGWSNPVDDKTYPYPSGVSDFSFTGLDPGTRYGIRVRYGNDAGWGAWSTTFYGTTLASDPPRSLTVSNVGPNSAHVTWQVPATGAAVTGYEVQYATNSTFTNAVTKSTTSLALDLAGLTAATKYWVRVRATTAVGDSARTSAVTFTTLSNVPTAPLNVQASSPGAGAAEVTWQVPASNGGSPIVGYMVQWSTDPTFASTLGQATPSRSPYTVQNLTPGVNVYFRVAARNGSGYGPWSAVASLTPTAGAWIKKAGTWQHAVVWIKKNGTWTKVQRVLTKKAGSWQ